MIELKATGEKDSGDRRGVRRRDKYQRRSLTGWDEAWNSCRKTEWSSVYFNCFAPANSNAVAFNGRVVELKLRAHGIGPRRKGNGVNM